MSATVGELKITNAVGTTSTVEIFGFDLQKAEHGGFLGISLPTTLALNAPANAGVDPPTPPFVEGTDASYTLSVDSPGVTARTLAVTLSGAIPSDFEVLVGSTIEQIGANGSFNVVLPAGESNVAFSLIDVTPDTGLSDIAVGASLTLASSLVNSVDSSKSAVTATPLTFNYLPTTWNTDAAIQPLDIIVGIPNGGGPGITEYQLDGNADYVATTGSNNLVGGPSGNDSVAGNASVNAIYLRDGNNIVVGNNGTDVIISGNGNSEIYGGAKISTPIALATVGTGTATGVQGDLITVQDGNNTVVGGNGNDFVLVGRGNDLVILGAGTDQFWGGVETTYATEDWNYTNGVLNNVAAYDAGFINTYAQPYWGNTFQGSITPSGIGNDTVFGGKGNDFIVLGNGNNYVEIGSGNSTVDVGMGNNTVIAGSGADLVQVGGGTEYILGGSGHDTLIGGDGSNTIIGGTGNSTIESSDGPGGLAFANASLNNNYGKRQKYR